MPAGGALFGSAATGPGSTGGNKHLVEMRAGKMNLKGHTVYADKRKGLLYVYQSEDSLMHFCWQDRTTGIVEDDLIIFPDDCEYVKVPQCTTGRVYLLKFKLSNRRFFFWLQEPSTDGDDSHCKRINEYLNNPSGTVQSASGPDQDLHSLLNNMSQSQLMQLFGGGQMSGLSSLLGTISGSGRGTSIAPAVTHRPTNSSATPTTTTTTTNQASTPLQSTPATVVTPNAPRINRVRTSQISSAPNYIQLSDLQNILQGVAPAPADQQSVDLSTALTGEALSGLLNNSEALEQLQSHLPPTSGNAQEQLRSTLASPQFQQAVSQFSSALESGQLGPVVSQLSVNSDAVAAAAQGNMQEFVKALEKSNAASAAGGNNSKEAEKDGKTPPKDDKNNKKKKNDDEDMQLD